MKEKKEIGTISFKIDKEELEIIASTGNLASFVEAATEHFRQNLKSELVNSVASGRIALVSMDGKRYGSGGPKGPLPHVFAEMKTITDRLDKMEVLIEHNIAING